MDLYVANCTNQVRVFHFRIPEMPSPWQATVPIGGQVKLPAPSGGFNPQQMERVVYQLEKAGGAPVSEASGSRKQVCLMWDHKPLSTAKMYDVIEQNQRLIKAEGEKLRKEAAIAIDSQVQSLGDAHQFQPPNAIEMSMVEEESADNRSPSFGEGLRVSRTEKPGETPRGRRGNKRVA